MMQAIIRGRTVCGFLIGCMVCLNPANADDWPQWRGPNRDGHVSGFKAPAVWPKELSKKWTIKIGEGHSSPIIVGNRAYTIVRVGDSEIVSCWDMTTGKSIWRNEVAAPFGSVIFPAQRLGKSPRSTPLFDTGKLYTIGVNGLMTCFKADSGAIIWRRDFSKAFPNPVPICGASLSPLIDGKKIYVHVGHEEKGAFLALDKESGEELWSWQGEGPGYTSPILATIAGSKQIVTASHNMWIALNPEDGKLLWSLNNRQNMFNHNSITPVVVGDTIICGANQRPTFALKVSRSSDKWLPEKLWESRDVTMSTSSPVVFGKVVYAFNEKRRGQIARMAINSGDVQWTCPGNKGENTSLYQVGGFLLAFTSNGELFAYDTRGDNPVEVAKYQLSDSATWASPAISGNRILVKGADSLILWEVPK